MVLKKEKNCTSKDRIEEKHKKWHISETDQNQKLSIAMNCQKTHNTLKTQKICRCVFKRCQNWRNIQ